MLLSLGLGNGTERVLGHIPLYMLMGESILDCLASSLMFWSSVGLRGRTRLPKEQDDRPLTAWRPGSRLRYGYTGFSDCEKGRELGKVSSHGEPFRQCSAKSHVARGYGELAVEI